MTAADYGELSLYYLFLAVTQTFYIYGLDVAYLRFYNLKDHGSSKAEVNGTTVIATVFSAMTLTAVLAAVSGEIGNLLIKNPIDPESVASNIHICLGILIFDTVSTYPFLRLRSENKPLSFASQKVINVIINLSLNFWFIEVASLGLQGILWANLVSSVATTAFVLPGILNTCTFKFKGSLFRDMLKFGLPNVPTYLFVMIVELTGRKVLEVYRGVEEAGLYSAGYKLGMFMGVVNAAFRFAWQPFFLKHSDDANAAILFSKAMTYYVLVTTYLMILLTLFVPPLIMYDLPVLGSIIAPAFWSGLSVFPIILAAHIFDGMYANLMVGIYMKKATGKLPLVTGAAALVTVIGNLTLVPTYGMMASAWVTLLAFAVQTSLCVIVVSKIYPIPYEWHRISKLLFLGGVFTLAGAALNLELGARVIIAVLFPVSLLIIRFFPQEEIRAIRAYMRI